MLELAFDLPSWSALFSLTDIQGEEIFPYKEKNLRTNLTPRMIRTLVCDGPDATFC